MYVCVCVCVYIVHVHTFCVAPPRPIRCVSLRSSLDNDFVRSLGCSFTLLRSRVVDLLRALQELGVPSDVTVRFLARTQCVCA
jgi:hypothetical protein